MFGIKKPLKAVKRLNYPVNSALTRVLTLVFLLCVIGFIAFNPNNTFAVEDAKDSELPPLSLEITDVPQISLPENQDFLLSINITNNSDKEINLTEPQLTRSRDWAIANSQIFKMINGETTQIYMTSPDISGKLSAGETRNFELKIPASELNWIFSPYQWRPYGFELCISGTKTGTSEHLTPSCDRGIIVLSATTTLQPMQLFSFAALSWPQSELPTSPLLEQIITDGETRNTQDTSTSTNPEETSETANDAEVSFSQNVSSPQFITDTNQAFSKFLDIATKNQLQLSVDPSLPLNESTISIYNALPDSARNLLPVFTPDYPSIAQYLNSAEQISLRNETLNVAAKKKITADYGTALISVEPDAKTGELFNSFGITQIVTDSSNLSTTITSTFNPDTRYQDNSLNKNLNIFAANPYISEALGGTLKHNLLQDEVSLSSVLQKHVPLAMTAIHYNQAPNRARAISVKIPDSTFTDLASGKNITQAQATLVAYQALAQAPWLKPTSITEAFTETQSTSSAIIQELPTSISKAKIAEAQIPQDIFPQVQKKISDIQNFASIFVSPEHFLNTAQLQKWVFLSKAWGGFEKEQKLALTNWYSPQEAREKLQFIQSAPINMISDQASLPLQISNPYNTAVNAKLKVTAPNYRLNVIGEPEISLSPNQTSAVSIPVKAHGAGTIEIKLQLIDDAGIPVTKEASLEMRLHPSWENTGTAIAAILVFGVLVLGVFKSIRSGRRGKQIN
ncbi:MAG: DUF6049 family protein [Arcanobacterium sp.]|nr:DUF6049 family protein [Arcanobacterium sp.]